MATPQEIRKNKYSGHAIASQKPRRSGVSIERRKTSRLVAAGHPDSVAALMPTATDSDASANRSPAGAPPPTTTVLNVFRHRPAIAGLSSIVGRRVEFIEYTAGQVRNAGNRVARGGQSGDKCCASQPEQTGKK